MHFHMTMLACLGAVRAYEDPADRYVLRRADRLLAAGVLDPQTYMYSAGGCQTVGFPLACPKPPNARVLS